MSELGPTNAISENPGHGNVQASRSYAGLAANVLLAMVLFVLTLVRLWPRIADTPFHRDEARWIANGALVREWRHPLGMGWQDEGYRNRYGSLDEVNRRRAQPPLAMYLIGIGLWVQGAGLPTNGYWIMSQSTQWNTDMGNRPTAEQLTAARRINVIVAALTVVAVFAITTLAGNQIGGVAAGLLYAFHPVVLDTSTRAWADPLFVLLVALAAPAGYAFARQPNWGRALLLGLLLGLGAATKLSPLLLAVGIGLAGLALIGWTCFGRNEGNTRRHRRLGWRMVSVPGIAWITLVGVYPYLWTAPVSHTYRLFAFRAESFSLQGDAFPAAAVPTRLDALDRARRTIGGAGGVGAMAAQWLHDNLTDWNWQILHHGDIALAVGGLAVVVWMLVQRGPFAPTTFMVGIVIAQAVIVLLAMKVSYPRYFLPAILATAMCGGLAIGQIADMIGRHLRGKSNH